jgi:hypothetical protein
LMIRDPDDLCRMISPMPFVLWFRNSLFFRASVFVPTSDSQRVLACASYTIFSVWKSSIYNGSRTLSTTLKRTNGYHFPRTFWRFSKKIQRTNLLTL